MPAPMAATAVISAIAGNAFTAAFQSLCATVAAFLAVVVTFTAPASAALAAVVELMVRISLSLSAISFVFSFRKIPMAFCFVKSAAV
jgi:hypothetical protein